MGACWGRDPIPASSRRANFCNALGAFKTLPITGPANGIAVAASPAAPKSCMIPVPKLPSLMFSAKLGARGPASISAVVISADGEAGNSPNSSAVAAPGTKLAAKLADCAGVMLGNRRFGGLGFIISLTEPPRLYPKMSTSRVFIYCINDPIPDDMRLSSIPEIRCLRGSGPRLFSIGN